MKKFYIILFLVFFSAAAQAQSKNTVASIEIGQGKVLRFYPNPATTVVHFEFTRAIDKNYTLQIYNFVGKKMFETTNVSQKTIVPLLDFFRGIYIYQLRDNTGQIVESGKFQVNK
jgi:hypothetical protein